MKVWKAIIGVGVSVGIGGFFWVVNQKIRKEQSYKLRYKDYYDVLNQWLKNKTEGKPITDYFKQNEIRKIAIYGMGEMGNRLYEDIKDTEVEVMYFIDKNSAELYYGADEKPIFGLEDITEQEEVDAIIVTPIYDFDKIEEDLLEVGVEQSIISLEDIVYEI